MQVNLKTLCIYFAPLVQISKNIGPGSTALLLSNLESVVQLSFIKHHSQALRGTNGDIGNGLPPDPETCARTVKRIIGKANDASNSSSTRITDSEILTSSLSFYNQLLENHSSGNTWISDENHTKQTYDELGNRLDKFGIYLYFKNIYYNFGGKYIVDSKRLKIFNRDRHTESEFDLAYKKFLNINMDLSESQKGEIFSLIKYIADPNRHQMNRNDLFESWTEGMINFALKHRDMVNNASSLITIQDENLVYTETQQNFVNFLRKEREDQSKNSNPTPYSSNRATNITPQTVPIPSVTDQDINLWIDSNNIERLSAHLNLIDDHPESAKSLKKINPFFIYGSEQAQYPKGIIQTLVNKKKLEMLKQIGKEHVEGFAAEMSMKSEEIFLEYYKINHTNPDKKYLKALLDAGFTPSTTQKKYLIDRAIVENTDSEIDLDNTLFELLCQKNIVEFNEYIEDRGVTPFHLLLLKGKPDLIEHVRVKYINIIDPNLKIKFIPVILSDDKVTSYWSTSMDKLPETLSNINPTSNLKVRKNWTPLMLAAATLNIRLFTDLLSHGAHGTGMSKMLKFLNHSLAFWNEMKNPNNAAKFRDFKDDLDFSLS